MSLSSELAAWDGKSADDIRKIYEQHCEVPNFALKLSGLINEPALQKGITWLLKAHLESAGQPDPEVTEKICDSLQVLQDWEPKLHVLQCLQYLKITEAQKDQLAIFLRSCIDDEVKFVRAWGYGGFYELSLQFPEFRKEAERYAAFALETESASVRARLRKVMKTA